MTTIHTGTWANRPLASPANLGDDMVITDVPLGGRTRWISDGQYWVPEVPVVLLSNGNIGTQVEGDTHQLEHDATLLDVRIPAWSMRENGRIDLDLSFESNKGDASNKRRFRVFVGNWMAWQIFAIGSTQADAYAFRVSFMAAGVVPGPLAGTTNTRLVPTSPGFTIGVGVGFAGFAPEGLLNMSGDVSLQVRCAVGGTADWTRLRSAFVVLR